jgi:hydroxymethylpyrimidine/phosphomethylpyrimidine kinase
MRKILIIAGSDCSGGAGIQADIKTITAHKMYAMSVITALTAQNTTSIYGIMEVPSEFVSKQIDCIFTDIYPDAIKIGMVSNSHNIDVIAEKLHKYAARNIVIDPVMVSTSGVKLISDAAIDSLVAKLLPIATVITPNIPEAEVLCGFKVKDEKDMIQAAEMLAKRFSCAILVKGGHRVSDAIDLLYENGNIYWYKSKRVNNPNTHGTGCTLSSAIACNLAEGKTLYASVQNAKDYLTGALKAMLDLGKGPGPINHTYNL